MKGQGAGQRVKKTDSQRGNEREKHKFLERQEKRTELSRPIAVVYWFSLYFPWRNALTRIT